MKKCGANNTVCPRTRKSEGPLTPVVPRSMTFRW